MTFLESDIILHLRLNLTIKNDVLFINTFWKDFWDVIKDSGSNGKKCDVIGTRNNKIIKSKRTIFKDIGCCLLVRLAFVWDCVKHFINIFSNWTAYQLFMCKHLLTSVNILQITQIQTYMKFSKAKPRPKKFLRKRLWYMMLSNLSFQKQSFTDAL